MNQEEILSKVDEMILLNKNKENDELWVSPDIFINLNISEYRGYKIYTSHIMPEDYMVIGKSYDYR